MSKALIVGAVAIGAVAVGAVVLGRRLAAGCAGRNVETMLERMPDTAPPKWMFQNVAAIRENTDRILARLEEREHVRAPDEREPIAT
jgi:hypothetical protein